MRVSVVCNMVIVCVVGSLVFMAPGLTRQETTVTNEAKIAPQFAPVLSKLRKSTVPVYLPSWLPSNCTSGKVYISVDMTPLNDGKTSHQGYSVVLATNPGDNPSMVSRLFELTGSEGYPIFKSKRHYDIGHGLLAYEEIGGNHPTLDWKVGKYSYSLSDTGPEMVQVAKSMVLLKK